VEDALPPGAQTAEPRQRGHMAHRRSSTHAHIDDEEEEEEDYMADEEQGEDDMETMW